MILISVSGLQGHGHSHGGGHSHNHGGGHEHNHDTVHKQEHEHTHDIEKDCVYDITQEISYDSSSVKAESNHKVVHQHNTNIDSLWLHIIGDLLGSIAVMISGFIIKYVKSDSRFYADPTASVVVAIIISVPAIRVTWRCINILLHKVPDHINMIKLKSELIAVDGVANIHHFHLWQHTDTVLIAMLHCIVDISNEHKSLEIVKNLEKILHKYGVHVTTVQIEVLLHTTKCSNLICMDSNCYKNLCCSD